MNVQGDSRKTKQLCYVAEDIHGVYLSKSACIDLGVIDKEFPRIGAFENSNLNSITNDIFMNKDKTLYSSSSYECTLDHPKKIKNWKSKYISMFLCSIGL